MCGIAGFWNPKKQYNSFAERIMTQLLFVSQLRGRDSTGIFCQDQKEDFVDKLKIVGPVDEFHRCKEVHDRVYKSAEWKRFIVGHVRAATIGDADDINAAHPHETENITLVHNGTLSMYPDKHKHISDSAWFASALEANPNFVEVEKPTSGTWALVWHDKRDNSLNFVRNAARPLNFAQASDGVVWFASEKEMLDLVLIREKKKILKSFELKERTWVKVLPDNTISEINVPFVSGKPKRKNCSAFVEHVLTATEWASLPETKRAHETIQTGNVKSWNDIIFKAAELPKPVAVTYPTPAVIHHQNSPAAWNNWVAAREQNVRRRERKEDAIKLNENQVLEDWAGLTRNSKIYFFPLEFGMATNSSRTVLNGAALVFDESGYVSPLEGVEVRGRLSITHEEGDKTIELIRDLDIAYEAVIKSITHDMKRKKIVLWVADAEPQDWFTVLDPQTFDQRRDNLQRAMEANYPDAASEVAAIEKKFEGASQTSS